MVGLPPPPPPPPGWRGGAATYEPVAAGRVLPAVIIGALALFAVPMLISVGSPDGPPPAFAGLWIAALGWNAYWWLFRLASRLEVVGDELRWATPLRRGEIPLGDLIEVRPARFGPNMVVFVHHRGRVPVMVTTGFQQFAERLHAAKPGIAIRAGWRDPSNGASGSRFRWRYVGVLLLPFVALALFFAFWSPDDDPIVNTRDGPFFVGTIVRRERFSLPSPSKTLQEPGEPILAAVCHNYFDWLDDVTLDPSLILIEPDDGLLRSAELLDGEIEPTPQVLEAERLAATGSSRPQVMARMQEDDWTSSELADADEYLGARALPPSPRPGVDYAFYVANVTTQSVVLARLEVDLSREIGKRPSFTRVGDLSLRLPGDKRTWGINESECWK